MDTIAVSCASNSCPTIYNTDRGTIIVQGYFVDPGVAGVSVPEGEKLVEIPLELLRSAVKGID